MPRIYRIFNFVFPFCFFFAGIQQLHATHNRAGEISIEQVGDCTSSLTVKATIVTYTKASSRPADRDTLTICWGDGTCERIARINGPGSPPQGEQLENDTKMNIYCGTHTYPARGTYVVSMTDPNRNGGILNVNRPNSDQIKFHIQTTYTFPNPQFQGCNDTPVLLQPPIDIGCVGEVFTHNPNAYDADGDSLSYHFIRPLEGVGQVVPNYHFPDSINPGPGNILTIDEVTGDIRWDAPRKPGEYNLAMIIIEWREGFPMDTIVRDMQILIEECDNKPPEVVTSIEEICVIAGETVSIEVTGTAPLFEMEQRVRLTALGGPFEVLVNPATFEPASNDFEEDPVTKIFTWETTCEHISDQYYSVVFKATDNFFADTSGLATLKTVRIKVVGPPPEDLTGRPTSEYVDVSWELPYFCEDADDDYFRGFTVWRREGSNDFPLDTCSPGLAGRGYIKLTQIAFTDIVDNRYFYRDEDVVRGKTYCYRILAEFAKTTPTGNLTYNRVESLPSEEICVQLSRDVPLITNVDVVSTSTTDGQIRVCWSKPKGEDLDTLLNPGPYVYEVLRAEGFGEIDDDFRPIGVTFTSPTFHEANDTCFLDTGLNTVAGPYSYKINFYVNNNSEPLGATNGASSVYLSASPTDNTNNLSWQELVPWTNTSYLVFRFNPDLGDFEEIATVNEPSYSDKGLINGKEYCYKVQSIGSYNVEGIINPILNFSQELCSVPIDNVPPCPPRLTVDNVCDQLINCNNEEDLVNTLNWINPMELCEETDDVVGYNVYYAPIEGSDFSLIASFDDSGRIQYEHKPERGIAGCYAVTAIDTFFNESDYSEIICVDNCPIYNLPNTFTPNGDGQNDLFTPYPFCFIESIDFQVFNRWGQIVFQTNDPNINWDGKNLNGQDLKEGVYFYTCNIFEQRVSGIQPGTQTLNGYIELIRGNK